MDLPKSSERKNPRDTEGFLSKITFGFMEPLFGINSDKKLSITDCFQPHESETLKESGSCLEKEWSKEIRKKEAGGKASLRLAMTRAYWYQYALTGFLILLRDSMRFMQPILLEKLLVYFAGELDMGLPGAFLIVLAIGACNVIQGLVGPQAIISLIYCCHRWEAGVVGLLYKKVLAMPQQTVGELNTGHVVEVVTSDSDRFGWLIWHLHDIWILPLHLSVCIYLVYCQIGWPVLFGLIVVAIALPLQAIVIFKCHKNWTKQHKKTDERVSMMSEVIGGMRVIKMYCWEKPFGKVIDALRQSELTLIAKAKTTGTLLGEMGTLNVRLLTCVVLVAFVSTQSGAISATKVFPMIAILNILSDTVLRHVPWGWKAWMEVSVSAKRIQDFLLLPEINKEEEQAVDGEPEIEIEDFTAQYEVKKTKKNKSKTDDETTQETKSLKTVLQKINLKTKGNKLVAIVGPVGSGKSSVLLAILKELKGITGSIKVKGTVSYTAQQPWIFSSTIRQNILFGQEYNSDRYEKVLQASALLRDLEKLPHGDKSLVGEKGITLSGGQKARISLARALYANADIVLLDDPLSAVDAEVGTFLFNKCINGYLKDKLRILCTHQTQFLQSAKHIIVLNKNGEVDACGSYKEIVATGNDFLADDKLSSKNRLEEEKDPADQEDTKDMEQLKTFRKQMSVKNDEEEEDEDKFVGKITWRSYRDFFTAGTSLTKLSIVIMFCLVAQAAQNISDWWMSHWTNMEEKNAKNLEADTCPAFNFTSNIETICPISEAGKTTWAISAHHGIGIYLGLTVIGIAIRFSRAILYKSMTLRSSRILHDKMYNSVIRSPVRFYDANPKGRILNRFSGDIGSTDGRMPEMIIEMVEVTLSLIGNVTIILSLNPWTLLPVAPLAFLMSKLRTKFCNLQKRLEKSHSEAKSSMLTQLNSSIDGMSTIRAFKVSDICVEGFEGRYDAMIGGWNTGLNLWAWFQVRNNLITAVFNCTAILIITFFSTNMSAAECGLALTYIAPILGIVDCIVRNTAQMELEMVKSERVLSYTKLEPEAELTSSNPPAEHWPEKGNIEFRNVNFKYHEGAQNVLKDLNLSIEAGAKVGVVGRTGAGKSSIIQALFRMAEPEGEIEIDGVKTADIGLHELRSKLSIIPQDPVLFKGSIRYNIDPFNDFSDEKILNVLSEVQLGSVVNESEDGLDTQVTEGGSNLSVGQKQLFCLARAILKNNKILLIDEATANVDKKTDKLIQKTIREKFHNCTVITIAHRINTILDSDKILVMSDGQMVEYASPDTLLEDSDSHFTKLVVCSGLSSKRKQSAKTSRDIVAASA